MDQKLYVTPSALADLYAIVGAIAKDAPDRASAFGEALLDRAEQAAAFPRSGRVVPELRRSDVRELIRSPIRIIYRLKHDGVIEIDRFWHAARGEPDI